MNETAAMKLGYPEPNKAIGEPIFFDWRDSPYRFEIIGVVKDFNFEGLKEPIQPFAFQTAAGPFNYLVAHIKQGNPSSVISSMESAWRKLNPNEPFEYSFLDQDFQKNYQAESRLSALVRYFMVIAIALCCLGLLGLVTFSAEQRTKEIGIRKVLGSSVTGIVGLKKTIVGPIHFKVHSITNCLATAIKIHIAGIKNTRIV